MKKHFLTVAMAGALSVLVTGCPATTTGGAVNGSEPDWYMNPPALCDVGSYRMQQNKDLAKDSAVSGARVALARQFNTKVQGQIKKYAQEGNKDGADFSESMVTSVSRDLVDMKLTGTRPVKIKVVGNELYALVCMDAKVMQDALNNMNSLSAKQKTVLQAHMNNELEDMDKQLDKLRSQE